MKVQLNKKDVEVQKLAKDETLQSNELNKTLHGRCKAYER